MSNKIFTLPVAESTPFEPLRNPDCTGAESVLESTDVQCAIEECYHKAKGIKTFPFELHYVSGTGGGTTMNNNTFFRVRPGTFSSGSYGGYPSCFPLQMPFKCRLYSVVLTFALANFNYSATPGQVALQLTMRDHTQNGSSVHNQTLLKWGNYSGTQIPYGFNTVELFASTVGDGFQVTSGSDEYVYGQQIGVLFTLPGLTREIQSFSDIVMKLNFEEVLD